MIFTRRILGLPNPEVRLVEQAARALPSPSPFLARPSSLDTCRCRSHRDRLTLSDNRAARAAADGKDRGVT